MSCPVTSCDYASQPRNHLMIQGAALDDTTLNDMFRRALMERAMSAFRFRLPRRWNRSLFMYCLYEQGYVGLLDLAKYGIIPQPASLSGYTVQYQPAEAFFENPCYGSERRKIHYPEMPGSTQTQCAIIRLRPDYSGIMDMVSSYSNLLTLGWQDVGVNLINSKLSWVMIAKNKGVAETLKKLYADIASGKPATVVDSKLFDDHGNLLWQMFDQDVKGNFIADELLEVLRGLLDAFDTEIGLPNANTQKKERMIVDEVNANNTETASRCELWLETLRGDIETAKELWPDLELSVDWRFQPQAVERGVDNVDKS